MQIEVKENKRKNYNWYHYEKQCIKRHKTNFPNQQVYHWENVPEDLLMDSGFIYSTAEVRQKRKWTSM